MHRGFDPVEESGEYSEYLVEDLDRLAEDSCRQVYLDLMVDPLV